MSRRRFCVCILCAVAAALLAVLLSGLNSPASAQEPAVKPVSFVNDVAPILKENCFGCHDSRKRSGKFDMTTAQKLMAGGSNGEAVVPGKPAESELYNLVVATDDTRMPPPGKGEPVPAEQARMIERWIREGARLDAGLDARADLVRELRRRWQPPVPPAVYPVPAIVNALAFTPDGRFLVVGGNHELTVWTAADGELTKRIRTRSARAYAMLFHPDGQLIVAGGRPGQEGDVCVYDITARGKTADGIESLDGVNDPNVLHGKLLETDDSALCLALSADCKTLAAGGCDRAVRIWSLSGGVRNARLEQTVENHADWVLDVALSGDGKYLATASRDRTAKVWDVTARESIVTFPSHQGPVHGVVFNTDATIAYSVGADRNLRSWQPTANGKQVKAASGHGDEVFTIQRHPLQPILATASRDRTVRLWDVVKLEQVRTLTGLTDEVFAVAFSPDGTRVAAGAFNGEVRVWSVADGKPITAFIASPGHGSGPSGASSR